MILDNYILSTIKALYPRTKLYYSTTGEIPKHDIHQQIQSSKPLRFIRMGGTDLHLPSLG